MVNDRTLRHLILIPFAGRVGMPRPLAAALQDRAAQPAWPSGKRVPAQDGRDALNARFEIGADKMGMHMDVT